MAMDLMGVEERLREIRDKSLDFVVDTRRMRAVVENDIVCLDIETDDIVLNQDGAGAKVERFHIRPWARGQLQQKLLPASARYFNKMVECAPDLLAHNLNHWFQEEPDNRLVRTIKTDDGPEIRAFLSNRYRILDSYDLLFTCLDTFHERGVELWEACVTDTRFYIKAIDRRVAEKVAPGGVLERHKHEWVSAHTDEDGNSEILPIATIRNSDVGNGGLAVSIGVFTMACKNTAIVERALNRIHIGKQREEGLYLTDETLRLEDALVWAKVRDIIGSAFTPERFKKIVELVKGARSDILAEPTKAVEAAAKNAAIGEDDKRRLMDIFLRNGDPSRFGLSSAVTEYAQLIEDYEQRIEMETVGGALLVGI